MASSHNASSDSVHVDEVISSAFVLASYVLLVLPLSLFVLYLGFLQWKAKRSDASWAVGHSDFSAYNLAVMEIVGLAGFAVVLHGKMSDDGFAVSVGSLVNKAPWCGQLLFPIFTCLEHYLAVVRPMTYLNLKRARGSWIRNASTGVVWLLSVGAVCYVFVFKDSFIGAWIMGGAQMALCLVAVVFCCVSVLHVLLQPKPGDEKKGKFDKSKRRAVRVILAVMGTLLLRFVGNIALSVWCILVTKCSILGPLVYWLNLSSSLTLFVLYLQRAGKLPNCKRNNDS